MVTRLRLTFVSVLFLTHDSLMLLIKLQKCFMCAFISLSYDVMCKVSGIYICTLMSNDMLTVNSLEMLNTCTEHLNSTKLLMKCSAVKILPLQSYVNYCVNFTYSCRCS